MKNIILLCISLFSLNAVYSQNVISNGDFSKEVSTKVGNPARVKGGEWFFFNVAPEGQSRLIYTEDRNIEIRNEPGKGTTGWNKVYLGQRLKNVGLNKGVYRVTFEVKSSEKSAQVGVYIKKTVESPEIDPKTGQKFNNFFIQADYNFEDIKDEKRSGALAVKRISNSWSTVSFDFSTKNTISAHNTRKINNTLYVKPVTNSMLDDCFLAIYCPTKGTSIGVDNVKIEKVR